MLSCTNQTYSQELLRIKLLRVKSAIIEYIEIMNTYFFLSYVSAGIASLGYILGWFSVELNKKTGPKKPVWISLVKSPDKAWI